MLVAPGQPCGFEIADLHRLAHQRVALVYLRGDRLRLDARELRGADTFVGDAAHLGAQGLGERLRAGAGGGHAVQVEQRWAAVAGVVAGAHADRDALVAHQAAGEAGAVVAVEHRGEHIERVGLAVARGVAQRGRVPAHRDVGQLGGGLHHRGARAALRRLGRDAARRQLGGGNGAVGPLGVAEHLAVVHIAHHHQVGVIGRVPAPVPRARILRLHGLEVGHPADHRAAIGVGLVGGGHQLLEHQRARLVVGAQAAFFLDHLDLARELLVGEHEVLHAVGLERHHRRQLRRRHLLEVGGVVLAGEGVVASADGGHAPVELARADLLGTLEHHVLEHVGDTRDAVWLVHRAGAVPHHVHHRGRAAVFLDDQLHAVGERGLEGVGEGGRSEREGEGRAEEEAAREAISGAAGEGVAKHGLVLHLLESAALREARCAWRSLCRGAAS